VMEDEQPTSFYGDSWTAVLNAIKRGEVMAWLELGTRQTNALIIGGKMSPGVEKDT